MRRNGRQTALASLLALALLLGSLMTAGSPVHADEPAAVFYGYVIPEPGGALPKRVRALSARGTVCGSADVAPTLAVVFYAIAVVSGGVKDGCPTSGDPISFTLVYGLVDEGFVVGAPASFRSGEVTPLHLIRPAADTSSAALHLQ